MEWGRLHFIDVTKSGQSPCLHFHVSTQAHQRLSSDNILVQGFSSCKLLSQGSWKPHQDKPGWRHGAWAGPTLSEWSWPDGTGEREDGEQTSKLVSKLCPPRSMLAPRRPAKARLQGQALHRGVICQVKLMGT